MFQQNFYLYGALVHIFVLDFMRKITNHIHPFTNMYTKRLFLITGASISALIISAFSSAVNNTALAQSNSCFTNPNTCRIEPNPCLKNPNDCEIILRPKPRPIIGENCPQCGVNNPGKVIIQPEIQSQ